MVKFMHLRHIDGKQHEDGKIHPRNHGGMTVAYTEEGNGIIKYAVAFCGSKDNFNYATGRVKAAGRLNSERYQHTVLPSGNEIGSVEERLVRAFVNRGLWRGPIWSRHR